MKPKKEFMLVRLHQTPEKPTRISKPLRSNLLSDMSNQPSSRDLGIFIARNNPTDASGPAYFIAKIMPDGLVKRYTITRLFPFSQWKQWASETWFQVNIHFFIICRDGRLQIGDEIVNVNGRRLRGLSMDSARGILSNYSTSENFTKTMNTKR